MYTLEENHGIPHGLVRVELSKELDNDDEPVIMVYPDAAYAYLQGFGLPLYDLHAYLGELKGIVKSYGSMGRRSEKALRKGDKKLNKHAMHLIRLYLMAFDILEKSEINTYREHDLDLLMSIRNGKFMLEDGSYAPEFFEMVSRMDARLKHDAVETSLPDHPDMKKIEEMLMTVNRTVL